MNVSQSVATEQSISVKENPNKVVASRWKALFLVGLTIFVYYDVMWRLIHQWSSDPNFSHGFIVPLFSAFVVWTQRQKLMALPVNPSGWGLLLIVGSLAMVIVGSLGAELFIARISLILLSGRDGDLPPGLAAFSSATVSLAIPVLHGSDSGNNLCAIDFAPANSGRQACNCGAPNCRHPGPDGEGNVIALPAMPLEVAEACSGIRSLLSLGTLAIIYGYFLEERLIPRILIALAAIPIAVLANGFRIFGTGVLVQYWDADKALGFFHEFSGWLVFVVSMFLLFLTHKTFAVVAKINARRKAI